MTYKGYLNYYLGTRLKTYQFENFTSDMYYMLVKLTRMKATTYVGALVLQCEPKEGRMELVQLVDQDFLLPTPDSRPTLINKR